jgi:hypothetical protein
MQLPDDPDALRLHFHGGVLRPWRLEDAAARVKQGNDRCGIAVILGQASPAVEEEQPPDLDA